MAAAAARRAAQAQDADADADATGPAPQEAGQGASEAAAAAAAAAKKPRRHGATNEHASLAASNRLAAGGWRIFFPTLARGAVAPCRAHPLPRLPCTNNPR